MFLNFTNGLTTREIYSGLLHEVWLQVVIAEIGTDAVKSRWLVKFKPRTWVAKCILPSTIAAEVCNSSGWMQSLILQAMNTCTMKGLATRDHFYVHSYCKQIMNIVPVYNSSVTSCVQMLMYICKLCGILAIVMTVATVLWSTFCNKTLLSSLWRCDHR